ncbi:MAG: pectinesterase family protein [Pyrinomonadaceae bacterium]
MPKIRKLMNDLPRQKLIEIVKRHGKSILEDARRCEGLFRDNFGSFRREISVLTMAVEEGVARDLATVPQNKPRGILLARLTQRLIDNLALTDDAAKWAVNSWALALGQVSQDDLKILETSNTAKTESVAVSAVAQNNSVIQNKPPQIQARTASDHLIIVSAVGDGDFVSISEAIKAARAGAQILVRPGLYEENIILDKKMEIAGDGAVQNIVVRSRDKSCVSMQTDRAIIRNLTLQCVAGNKGKTVFGVDIANGEMTLQNCDVSSDSLACIAVRGQTTNSFIRDCLIHNGSDSGIYFFEGATGTIEECEIYQNKHSNVVIAQNANPTFKNCRIFKGENAGFFVYQNGLGTIDDCDIYGHAAGEVVVSQGGSPVLRGCQIHDSNNAGVFVQNQGRALLEGCNIYGNLGAGVSFDGGSIGAINRCRINANGKVAVRVKGQSIVRVENSDLTGNRLAAWETEHGVTVENINNND